MSGGQYVAAAYGVVLVFLLAYVAIIAAKLARLQRDTADILRSSREQHYAARVQPEGSAEDAE